MAGFPVTVDLVNAIMQFFIGHLLIGGNQRRSLDVTHEACRHLCDWVSIKCTKRCIGSMGDTLSAILLNQKDASKWSTLHSTVTVITAGFADQDL